MNWTILFGGGIGLMITGAFGHNETTMFNGLMLLIMAFSVILKGGSSGQTNSR